MHTHTQSHAHEHIYIQKYKVLLCATHVNSYVYWHRHWICDIMCVTHLPASLQQSAL